VIDLTVNGQTHGIDADPDTPLLYVLREDLQLNAAKFGCGLGQCGACTVLVDGAPALACVIPIMLLAGKQITTLEGIGTLEDPAPIQQAFMEEQAAQCGFCIAGMMMRAQALLQANPRASDAEIRAHLQPNLCRCGTHLRILRAVHRAAALILSGHPAATHAAGASGQAGGAAGPDRHGSDGPSPAAPEDRLRPDDRDLSRHPQQRERPER
jgi:nicotinate dehydrogenase subunit A